MRRVLSPYYAFFLGLFLLLAIFPKTTLAQWEMTQANVLDKKVPDNAVGGALTYQSGTLWAGYLTLVTSTDQGATWTQIPGFEKPYNWIYDIQFLNQTTGLVTTTNTLYKTTDAGKTWTDVFDYLVEGSSACFAGSPNDVVSLQIDGQLLVTHDGGLHTKTITLSEISRQVIYRNGILYALAGDQNKSSIFLSTDKGDTWQTNNGSFGADCYTFAPDSCLKNTYVMNEAALNGSSGAIFRSSDNGGSWIAVNSQNVGYYSGAIATGYHTIYALTTANGVARSTDQGSIWTSIDGPSSPIDANYLCVINDNVILAIDYDGSVWRTTNSGGYPINSKYIGPSLSTSTLFLNDTVAPCSSLTRSLQIIPPSVGSCIGVNIVSEKILGGDSSYYTITHQSDLSLSTLDSIVITLAPNDKRDYSSRLAIELNDGSMITVPLYGTGSGVGTTTLSATRLFVSDTTASCASITRSVVITPSVNCAIGSLNVTISGPDANAYTIKHTPSTPLTAPDSIVVEFTPNQTRDYSADLTIDLGAGNILHVSLLGHGTAPGQVAVTPQSLFTNDTTIACHTVSGAVTLTPPTGCPPIQISSIGLIGNDANAYTITHDPSSIISKPDSILITLDAEINRDYSASVLLTLADGSTITIPLAGHGTSKEDMTLSTSSLFNGAIVGPCQSLRQSVILIPPKDCPAPTIISQHISGADSDYYVILHSAQSPLLSEDSIVVSLQPDGGRDFNAMLTVTLSDGTTHTVTLLGHGTDSPRFTLSAQNITTNAVGDFVIPIHTDAALTNDFNTTIRYDTTYLVYEGAFSAAGNSLELSRSRGRVDIRLTTTQDSALAFLHFGFYPADSLCTTIIFDSLRSPGSDVVCASATPGSMQICATPECSKPIISSFMRYRSLPALRITPNPATSDIWLHSNRDIANAEITICDMLGTIEHEETLALHASDAQPLGVTSLSPGLHFLRLRTAEGTVQYPIMIQR